MKIAITGSCGFIGSKITNRLEELGIEVLHLDIQKGVDITEWEQIKNIEPFNQLIHLAGKTFVPDSYENPTEFYRTSFIGTMHALELCRMNKAKMIYTSSYIYGEPKYLPIDEKHAVKAFNPYAQAKLIGEQLCEGYSRDFGVSVIIFRPFNIYGKGQSENFLIPSIIKQAKNGQINLKDPAPKRDLLHVDDFTEAFVRALSYNQDTLEIFNIGYGKSYTVLEIAELINRELKYYAEVKFSGEVRKIEIMDTVADISKAQELLKWNPVLDLTDGIQRSI